MTDLDTKKLKQAYPEVPESFHNTVTETLDSLGSVRLVQKNKSSNRKKIIAFCVAAAVLGTFTVTAAATHFFGFIVTHNGSYGLNIKAENSDPQDVKAQSMNLKFGYMPEKYKNSIDNDHYFSYNDGEEYFNARIIYAETFDNDYLNVIESSETEYDGRKIVYMTFKEAENSDKLYYSSLKYFDEYNCVMRINCSDKEELIKITEQAGVEPAPEDEKPADLRESDYNSAGGALGEYENMDDGRTLMEEYFAGNIKKVGVGDTMDFSLADYDQPGVNVKVKVNSFEKREDSNGLDKNDFTDIGDPGFVYYQFFDENGKLVKEETSTIYDGADEDNLGTVSDITYIRNFYIANMEITADGDIDDLNKVLGTEIYGIDDNGKNFYNTQVYPSGERAMCIYRTGMNRQLSVKKGETVRIKVGFIAENDTPDITYLMISGIDEPEDDYRVYMIKVKE